MRALALLLVLSGPAFAAERCFELFSSERAERTVGQLCVDERLPDAVLTLRTGAPVATWQLGLTERVRCLDCNRDVFAPASRDLDFLTVRFDGKRESGAERGTVTVGPRRFFYRAGMQPPPAEAAAPRPANEPMSAEAFGALQRALDDASFSVSRTESTIASAAAGNWFTSEQVAALIKRLPVSFRDESANQLVPKVVDGENLFKVSAVLGRDAKQLRGKVAAKR